MQFCDDTVLSIFFFTTRGEYILSVTFAQSFFCVKIFVGIIIQLVVCLSVRSSRYGVVVKFLRIRLNKLD